MKKFGQIQGNKVHWIFDAEEKPPFHPSVVIIDITGREDIKEGWAYNAETGVFTEPLDTDEQIEETQPQPSLEEVTEETLLETKYQTFLLEMMI